MPVTIAHPGINSQKFARHSFSHYTITVGLHLRNIYLPIAIAVDRQE
jgi:hypothetical protein